MVEPFWTRMQTGLLDRRKWATVAQLSAAMADNIDSFHKEKRGDSSLAVLMLTKYEKASAPYVATNVNPAPKGFTSPGPEKLRSCPPNQA